MSENLEAEGVKKVNENDKWTGSGYWRMRSLTFKHSGSSSNGSITHGGMIWYF